MPHYVLEKFDVLSRSVFRAFLVVFCVVILVFFLMRAAPGDPVAVLLGDSATEESVAAVREVLGLNLPLVAQLGRYLTNVLTGDLGTSLVYQRPALDIVLEALPNTLMLGGVAFLIALLIALPAGIASAVWRGGKVDKAIEVLVLISQTIPPFWAGIILIHAFALKLHWLPTSGSGSWRHIVLPAVTLALFQIAVLIRSLRSAMLEVLKEDFIRTARAKGLGRWTVVIRHGFLNALAPVVTLLGLQLGTIMSGAVITEAVFAWPGIGSLGLSALLSRDYVLTQAVVVFTAVLVVSFNLLADIVVSFLDPRIRDSGLVGSAGGQ